MQSNVDGSGPKLLSFKDSVGRFLVVSPKGQLFALEDIQIAQDYSKVVPALCSADFHIATTVALKLEPSNFTLVLEPRDAGHSYFLSRSPGASTQPVRVEQNAQEIVKAAVAEHRFPVIVLADLRQSLSNTLKRMSDRRLPAPPIALPLRHLVLRSSAPDEWVESIKHLFLVNAEGDPDKDGLLDDRLEQLNVRIKRAMIRRYLLECLWTDRGRKRIGRMSANEDGSSLRNFVSGAPDLMQFIDALAVNEEGRYDTIEGVANVVPRMVAKMPWTAPTLHVYDATMRERYRLKEFYSLYEGLRELSVVGAPVLVNQPGALDTVIPVSIIKTTDGGAGMSPGKARVYPIRKVVWNT